MVSNSLEGAMGSDETKRQKFGPELSRTDLEEQRGAVEIVRREGAKGLLFFFSGSYDAKAGERTHLLRENPLKIGRTEGDITIPNSGVSQRHCTVYWKIREQDFFIRDLRSMNGTYVNGGRLSPDEERLLRTGDMVALGAEVRAYFYKR